VRRPLLKAFARFSLRPDKRSGSQAEFAYEAIAVFPGTTRFENKLQ